MTTTPVAQAVPRAYPHAVSVAPPVRFDWWLGTAALLLLGLGLVMVASASIAIADRQLGQPLYYFNRQALFVGIGLVCALITLKIDLRIWRKHSPLLLMFGMVLLGLVLVPGIGHEVNGASRWIRIGGFLSAAIGADETFPCALPRWLSGSPQ